MVRSSSTPSAITVIPVVGEEDDRADDHGVVLDRGQRAHEGPVRLDLDDREALQIRLQGIAGALSPICRFGAQARAFYTPPGSMTVGTTRRREANCTRAAQKAKPASRAAFHRSGRLDLNQRPLGPQPT